MMFQTFLKVYCLYSVIFLIPEKLGLHEPRVLPGYDVRQSSYFLFLGFLLRGLFH